MLKEITQKEADIIINNRNPLGLFWLKEGRYYIAIDNSTGDSWVEEFLSQKECFLYLEESG